LGFDKAGCVGSLQQLASDTQRGEAGWPRENFLCQSFLLSSGRNIRTRSRRGATRPSIILKNDKRQAACLRGCAVVPVGLADLNGASRHGRNRRNQSQIEEKAGVSSSPSAYGAAYGGFFKETQAMMLQCGMELGGSARRTAEYEDRTPEAVPAADALPLTTGAANFLQPGT